MSSGRFNTRDLLYTAGKKARERGRNPSNTKFDKLEHLRTKLSKLQINPLEDPCNYPEIEFGKEVLWNKLKDEYDMLVKAVNYEELDLSLSQKKIANKAQNQLRNYNAAVVSAKKHINDCVMHAKNLPMPAGHKKSNIQDNIL